MHSLPSSSRLLVVAVLLPAAVAGTNQLLFNAIPAHQSLRPWLYPWMTFTTAVLSWSAGRYLSPAWLRWIVFAWCLVLLDLITFAACLNGPLPRHFAYVFISAQASALVVWAVLAGIDWQRRLPAAIVAASIVVAFAGNWSDWEWGILVFFDAAIVALVCTGLRCCGFVLQHGDRTKGDPLEERSSPHQFGIKHLLIWAAAIAPLLVLARGFDFPVFANFGRQNALPAMVISLSFATITLVAIWTVLGSAQVPVRAAAFLLVPLFIAYGLDAYSSYTRPPLGVPWPRYEVLNLLWHMEGDWNVWLWLNAMLLAALLLFLRASGYRLARSKRTQVPLAA